MAEAAAALGLISSVISLVDFSSKLIKRLNEYQDAIDEAPEIWRNIAVQLPLLTIALQMIQVQAEAGHVQDKVAQALKLLVDETMVQTRNLDCQLSKILPPKTATTWERKLLAVKSLSADKEVAAAFAQIQDCVKTLSFSQQTTGVDLNVSILRELQKLRESSLPTQPNAERTTLLHQAARQGDRKAIRALHRLGTSIDAADELGMTPLHAAASCNRIDSIQALLALDANIDAQDENGQTPLHKAVDCRSMDAVQELRTSHKVRADENIRDDNGNTALDLARKTPLLYWQFQYGTSLDSREPAGQNTALIYAAIRGETDMTKELLQAGANAKAVNKRGSTAFAEACRRGRLEIISELLKHDADPNAKDHDNWSPLVLSLRLNQRAALTLLLQSGKADLKARGGPFRNYPVCEAVRVQNWPVLRLLLEHGADPNVIDFKGYPPIVRAVREGRNADVLQVLLDHGADVNAAQKDGQTALTEAVLKRWLGGAELLLKHGADANGKIATYPYLNHLCLNHVPPRITDTRWFRVFIDAGANVDSQNHDTWTPLRECVFYGYVDMVHELLELGADPVASTKYFRNMSLVMQSAARGLWCEVIIPDLLAHGATLEDKDNKGWTALRYAVERKHDIAAEVLLSAGADPDAKADDGETPRSRLPDDGFRRSRVLFEQMLL